MVRLVSIESKAANSHAEYGFPDMRVDMIENQVRHEFLIRYLAIDSLVEDRSRNNFRLPNSKADIHV